MIPLEDRSRERAIRAVQIRISAGSAIGEYRGSLEIDIRPAAKIILGPDPDPDLLSRAEDFVRDLPIESLPVLPVLIVDFLIDPKPTRTQVIQDLLDRIREYDSAILELLKGTEQ